ncbi:DUF2325 domain-containing protein [Hathewaya massiliensis]|uniref:DUF2325 domain-containing protein n=1 Tax=Hathewaya massiliensis TaxID=1964382 RepID=UPI00115C3FCC|nr:DUF2325 domain-containing protein [Hathewaya massiliensis]
MSVLVIGGDRIQTIRKKLSDYGFQNIDHVTGRKKNDKRMDISENFDLVLVLTDFIGHTLSKSIKNKGKEKDVKVLFAKRSWTAIEEQVKEFIQCYNK